MRILLLSMLFALGLTVEAGAQAIVARISTLGPGIDVSVPVGGQFAVRAGGSFLALSRTATAEDEDVNVDFDGHLSWGGLRLLGDWLPFRNGFRVTAGFYHNLIRVTGTGVPAGPYTMNEGQSNEKVFQPDRLGSLTATLSYGSSINPYLGLGFGDVHHGHRVTFMADAGVAYLGAPTIDLEGTGMISATAAQDANLTDGLSSFRWLPVVSIGLAVRM